MKGVSRSNPQTKSSPTQFPLSGRLQNFLHTPQECFKLGCCGKQQCSMLVTSWAFKHTLFASNISFSSPLHISYKEVVPRVLRTWTSSLIGWEGLTHKLHIDVNLFLYHQAHPAYEKLNCVTRLSC